MPQRVSPKCTKEDCFGNKNGRCMVLIEASDPCGFFQTESQLGIKLNKAYKRLVSQGYIVEKQFPGFWGRFKRGTR